MVKLIFNSTGQRVIDFDITDMPDGNFPRRMESCVLCGQEYNKLLYDNHADTCKDCWEELKRKMKQRLAIAIHSFTLQELKLLDEWSDLADVLFSCIDARYEAAKAKKEK